MLVVRSVAHADLPTKRADVSKPSPLRALVVGSISRDRSRTAAGEHVERPGGVVHYAGLALARLGVQVRVVTCVASEDAELLLGPLRRAGVYVHAVSSPRTTTYWNDYSGTRDGHTLLETSRPIEREDIPRSWRENDLVQLGPLHIDDLAAGLIHDLRGLIGLDMQGFARQERSTGFSALARFLPEIDILQASEPELESLLAGESVEHFKTRARLSELIVTRGAQGASVWTHAGRVEIPAHTVPVRDRTGAGDVFLASYLHARVRGYKPLEAARAAARNSACQIARIPESP